MDFLNSFVRGDGYSILLRSVKQVPRRVVRCMQEIEDSYTKLALTEESTKAACIGESAICLQNQNISLQCNHSSDT